MAPELVREAEIINQYLCQIKNNLPLWIRLNKGDLNEILDEIEDHIWEKAVENTDNQKPTEMDLQIAISQIGNPKEIANQYTPRSSPRVFISKELYPFYIRYIKILFLSCLFSLFFPFAYSFMVFGLNIELLSFLLRFYLLVLYITAGIVITTISFYLSTHGYLPYEARISKFYSKYSNLTYIQENSIKNPINSRNLVIWAFLWLVGAISFYILSVITINPPETPNPVGYFNCIFCSVLFLIKLIRIIFRKQMEILHRILIFMEFLLIFLFSLLYAIMDYRHQSGIENYDIITFLLIISQILIFPIMFIAINYKIYQIFSLKNRYEQYQTFLSLRKRLIKKQSYVKPFKKDKPKNLEVQFEKRKENLEGLREDHHFEKDLNLFMQATRKKLPIWLKKSEKDAILNEMNNEIRELMMDYQDDRQLTPERYSLIFNEVGDVNNIVSELKQKGTPKIFISDELWSSYKGSFRATLTYISIFVLFWLTLLISFNSFFISGLPMFISSMLLTFNTTFLTISGIFVILSLTDYIPYTKKNQAETLPRVKKKDKRFFWRVAISIIFAFSGSIFILSTFLLVELSTDFRVKLVVFLIGIILLILAGNELTLLSLRRHSTKLNFTLLTISLILVLILNFVIMYNAHAQLGFIRNVIIETFLFVLFFPVNMEIFYTIFRIFQVNIQ